MNSVRSLGLEFRMYLRQTIAEIVNMASCASFPYWSNQRTLPVLWTVVFDLGRLRTKEQHRWLTRFCGLLGLEASLDFVVRRHSAAAGALSPHSGVVRSYPKKSEGTIFAGAAEVKAVALIEMFATRSQT